MQLKFLSLEQTMMSLQLSAALLRVRGWADIIPQRQLHQQLSAYSLITALSGH